MRDTAGVVVENQTEVMRLTPYAEGVRAELMGPAGAETVFARKVVLAGGRDGSGAPYMPPFPSLGRGREAGRGRVFHSSSGTVPGLSHIHAFNAGSTMSQGALAGDIPGMAFGANRLSHAIASILFAASADALRSSLKTHEDRELAPTRYFLPR